MKELKDYHRIWLASHPDRQEEWLRGRLKDGFHIHHIDGNHYNNDPENLVLIEGADHFMLHGMSRLKFIDRKTPRKKRKRIRLKKSSMKRAALAEKRRLAKIDFEDSWEGTLARINRVLDESSDRLFPKKPKRTKIAGYCPDSIAR